MPEKDQPKLTGNVITSSAPTNTIGPTSQPDKASFAKGVKDAATVTTVWGPMMDFYMPELIALLTGEL